MAEKLEYTKKEVEPWIAFAEALRSEDGIFLLVILKNVALPIVKRVYKGEGV